MGANAKPQAVVSPLAVSRSPTTPLTSFPSPAPSAGTLPRFDHLPDGERLGSPGQAEEGVLPVLAQVLHLVGDEAEQVLHVLPAIPTAVRHSLALPQSPDQRLG